VKRAGALLLALPLVLASNHARAQLNTRATTFTWDKNGMLRATFNYRDAIDAKIQKRLFQAALPVTIVMRGYVYRTGETQPVALTAHTCRVAMDIWNDVFRVVVNGVSKPPVVNSTLNGVYRLCTDMVDLPIADRATLKGKPSDYYLAVKVEVNPISEQLIKEIQRWVTRPLGVSSSINPSAGDTLFATFVSVFMKKQVATAEHFVEFRTAAFPP
jgi:hypothetical protein